MTVLEDIITGSDRVTDFRSFCRCQMCTKSVVSC